MENVIEALNWRYAVNRFDTAKKLSTVQINELLEAVRLTPSSYGLQPWKFIVVTNPEVRAKLQAAGYNQPKISEASHLIVFAVPTKIDDTLVDTYVQSVSKIRGVPLESLKGYADMIKGSIAGKTPEQRIEWAARQAYIALGVLLTAAAVWRIDAGPMEGFDPAKFDEILGLDELGLRSVVIAAVGYRVIDDVPAEHKQVRFPLKEVVIEVK
jgi:nitroreductase